MFSHKLTSTHECCLCLLYTMSHIPCYLTYLHMHTHTHVFSHIQFNLIYTHMYPLRLYVYIFSHKHMCSWFLGHDCSESKASCLQTFSLGEQASSGLHPTGSTPTYCPVSLQLSLDFHRDFGSCLHQYPHIGAF